MTTYILSGALAVVIGALVWREVIHMRAFRVFEEGRTDLAEQLEALRGAHEGPLEVPETDPILTGYATRLIELEEGHRQTQMAVAEGIQHVERIERRIKATVRRAREELAERGFEHDGLEAEAHELRVVDGAGGEGEGMPAMYPDMGPPEQSSVPGVTPEQLRRVRGL